VVENVDVEARILLSRREETGNSSTAAKNLPQSNDGNIPSEPNEEESALYRRYQQIDLHTHHLPVCLHLDQYHQLLRIMGNFKQRLAAAKTRSPEKQDNEQSPSFNATEPLPNADAGTSDNKTWFSWAWNIMVEEEYVCLTTKSALYESDCLVPLQFCPAGGKYGIDKSSHAANGDQHLILCKRS